MNLTSGLSAFPLTPVNERGSDEAAFIRLIQRLVAAKVDSIGVPGSTGNYACLTMAERSLPSLSGPNPGSGSEMNIFRLKTVKLVGSRS